MPGKPARYLGALFRRWERAGAHAARDPGEARRIAMANRFALSYFCLTAPYLPVFMALGMWALAWGILPMLAWHAATLALNARGWATAARVSLGASGMVSILLTALALGRASGAHHLLLAASLNFLILFDWEKEKRIMAWGLAANSALYLGYQFLGARDGMLYAPPPEVARVIRAALSLANLIGIIAGVGHFLAGSARAERELIAAREKAEAADRIKSRFIANMSHEIRTPLNVILGLARLLENPAAEPQRRGFLANIRSSAADLLDILNDALDLSKIESGKIVLESRPFRLRELAESVLIPFRMQALQKGVDLRLEAAPGDARVLLGDPLRLRQVLNNLISNSIKFTSKGSVILRIAGAGGSDEKPAYRFEVADTGIGIAAEAQGRLFESFRQADGSITRTHGGSGLGLAICKGLVESMGGMIHLESRPGLGTTVHFTAAFPAGREENLRTVQDAETGMRGPDGGLRDPEPQQPEAEPHGAATLPHGAATLPHGAADLPLGSTAPGPGPETGAPPTGAGAFRAEPGTQGSKKGEDGNGAGNARILVVDDHRMNRLVLRTLLEAQGFGADEALDGEGALRACAERAYDLILMDYHMPVMDGLECTRRIRALGGAQPVIVGITADALPESRATCLAAGMDRVILKPVESADLRSILAPWKYLTGETASPRPQPHAPGWVDSGRLGNLVQSTRLRDPAYRIKAWEQFRSDTESLRLALLEAGRSGNARELKDAAHGLKGLCLTMGLNRLADACRRLEVVSQEAGRLGWPPALSDLEAAYGPSLAELGRALETGLEPSANPAGTPT